MQLKIDTFQSFSFLFMTFVYVTKSNILLDYAEIEKLGVSCPSYHLCSKTTENENPINKFCHCDQSCARYDTCCIDSPFVGANKLPRRRQEECSTIENSRMEVFNVPKCDAKWRGNAAIRHMCEDNRRSFRDPLGINPVTSKATNITYKNYFCALCNDDYVLPVLWNVEISIPANDNESPSKKGRNDILNGLEYHSNKNQWGIWKRNASNVWEFIPVSISFEIPKEVKSLIKRCQTDAISQCSPSWQDLSVRDKCAAYMAPIYVSSLATKGNTLSKFRNVHCALCNHVTNFTNANCFVVSIAGAPSLSFSLLLDVNQSDGDLVGESKMCRDSEVYDPFFKKCRALSCGLPGYTLQDGKCTRS